MKDASVVPAARILVIEDNPSDVFLLDRALKKQDLRFELTHLLGGDEALALVRRLEAYDEAAIPDLILLDLNLPRSTGEEILRDVGHLQRWPGHLLGGGWRRAVVGPRERIQVGLAFLGFGLWGFLSAGTVSIILILGRWLHPSAFFCR